jgi:hypothetical protein
MTNDQILTKAIERAQTNGWDGWKKYVPAFPKHGMTEAGLRTLLRARATEIIFSHDFAKALWKGNSRTLHLVSSGDSATVDGGEAWKAHLQMLAVTSPDERLKYLEPFL